MSVLVTGAAGFVGMHVVKRLAMRGETVIGLDDFNDYYDPRLKAARAEHLARWPKFTMVRGDIAEPGVVAGLVAGHGVDRVVHLAAQAGVRYSLENPFAYERSNLAGHLAVLEACRHGAVSKLVYASSSSVYGDRMIGDQGFRESEPAVEPVSLYAATKRSCELMSHCYSGLYGLTQAGLRFFTVYGPWGRPDMAYFSFTRRIEAGEPIEVFGEGRMARDLTYIDDIVDGVIGVLDASVPAGTHEVYNIGDSSPVGLMDMIGSLERVIGREAIKIMRPMQPGDVTSTFADISKLNALTGYTPKVGFDEGSARFVDWWRSQGASILA